MSIIVDIPKRSFNSVWDGSKPFHILDTSRTDNEADINLGHVISLRERNDRTNVLTGREINANITYVEPIPAVYYVIGLHIYQRIDFRETPVTKRKV